MSDRPDLDAILTVINQLHWLKNRGILRTSELAVLKWELLNSGGTQVRLVLNKLNQMAWLHKQGTLTMEEVEHLKQPLLATIGPIFLPEPAVDGPPASPPSSAGLPTTRLTPPDERWRYLTITVLMDEGADPVDPETFQATLDQYGADGWELAAALPQSGSVLLIFKRRDT